MDFNINLANWEFGIDYLNQIYYEVQNDKIVMYIKVGIAFHTNKGFTVGFQNDEGKFGFDVIYENEQFRLE